VGLWDLNVRPGSTAHRLEDVYLKALASVDAAEARKSAAVQSAKFTPEGIRADVLQYGASQLAPVLHKGKAQIAAAKRELADKRSQIKPPVADRTDMVGAMLRAEMRSFVKNHPDRDGYLRDLDKLSPEMAQALREVPAEMSGISPSQHSALVNRSLEATHAEAIAEVTELERAISLAEKAADLAREELAREAEIPLHQFDQVAKPFEERSGGAEPVWLKKFTEGGEEVLRAFVVEGKNAYFRTPTKEQLETGILAESKAQYEQIKSGEQA
jgi:hypothetical protein